MNIGYVLIVLVIVVGSVILHELAHGVVAYWFGDHTAKDAGRLTFNPIKHIDPFMSILVPVILYMLNAPVFGGAKPVPVNFANLKWREWGMALVALAGPFANFLLAFIFFLIGHFSTIILRIIVQYYIVIKHTKIISFKFFLDNFNRDRSCEICKIIKT